jgi:hypothetical protein
MARMHTVPTPEELQRIRDRVADGERLVSEQRGRIAELARDGHSTTSAARLLDTFERTLDIMRELLATEERLASGR